MLLDVSDSFLGRYSNIDYVRQVDIATLLSDHSSSIVMGFWACVIEKLVDRPIPEELRGSPLRQT